jgi:dihydroorotase
MIDPHVHLRDWCQCNKETVRHGLSVAYRAGLDAVFEMPNTDPPLTSVDNIEKRIEFANNVIDDLKINMFHGLYAGLTADPAQIEEMVKAHNDLFPRVVGLKMFAGNSTGNMGIIKEEDQKLVYKTLSELDYRGVLAVHCEKESSMRNDLWDPKFPMTHCLAKYFGAEVDSVEDQIRFAGSADYKGTLHICHVSVPKSLYSIREARDAGLKITAGITPHHAVLNKEMMDSEYGLLLKMNPPLRNKTMKDDMFQALLDGKIDWVETDHAPHTFAEKTGKAKDKDGNPIYASGIPVLPYYPHFINLLKENGASEELIENITHNNICRTFGIDIPNTKRKPDYNLAGEYEFNPFVSLGKV